MKKLWAILEQPDDSIVGVGISVQGMHTVMPAVSSDKKHIELVYNSLLDDTVKKRSRIAEFQEVEQQ